MSEVQRLAEQQWSALAGRFQTAMGFALPKLPESFRAALSRPIGGADARWGLALLLAGWQLSGKRTPQSSTVEQTLAELGVAPLVQQLAPLASSLPAAFREFLKVTQESAEEYRLAGAGSFLVSTVSELGMLGQSSLTSWLGGDSFTRAAAALVQKFPRPSAGATAAAQPRVVDGVAVRTAALNLDDRGITEAYLRFLNWPDADIQRFLAGKRSV